MRQKWLYRILLRLLRHVIRFRYAIKSELVPIPEGPNLILSNHVTDDDFLIIASGTKCDYMEFVLAENIMRSNFLKAIINLINNPVVHVKGSKSVATIREITKRLKAGKNVMLFPEGNTTYSGLTMAVDESIGKLAKLSNVNLVMIKIKGGYFTKPRWGVGLKRGAISLENRVITKEELKSLSVKEVTDIINESLYTDAYEEEEFGKQAYRGRAKSLGLERVMYLCPKCNKIAKLRSDKKHVWCECGYSARLDEYGYLKGIDDTSDYMTDTVKERVRLQKEWLDNTCNKYAASGPTEELFVDFLEVYDVTNNEEIKSLGSYLIQVYYDHIGYTDSNGVAGMIKIDNIKMVTIFKANTLTAFVGSNIYELRGDFSFNALKYRDLYEIYKRGE